MSSHVQVKMEDIMDDCMEGLDIWSEPNKDDALKSWNENFHESKLTLNHFKEYWKLYVPQVYDMPLECNCLEWSPDERSIRKWLLEPLEVFMCNSENPEDFFKHVREVAKNTSSTCGRVFKMSEPTYNCRECSTDPTCVLCVDCFKNSEHRNHKYKISTSSGGGCCDCGDMEAWQSFPRCTIHTAKKKTAASSDGDELSPDVAARCRIVFKSVLRYAFDLLTVDHVPELPIDLRLYEEEEDAITSNTYCTVLYNDETHTFEHVISTLQKVLKIENKESIDYVTNIDRVGRAVVKSSTFQPCKDLKLEIERITSRSTNKPLKVIVTHTHVIAHQMFAVKLLSWLQEILTYGQQFRKLFTEVVTDKNKKSDSIVNGCSVDRDISLLEGILMRDVRLWKMARVQWHRLFITGMMMEYENKKLFAKKFTKRYGHIMKDFIKDDHDHAVSIASMGVQLYTVPSIAHYLITKKQALFVVFNAFLSECNPYIVNGVFEFQRNQQMMAFKRSLYMIYDLNYLLASLPTKWTDEIRKAFLHGFSFFLKLLYSMQGMDAAVRQVGQHLEYEAEWETAFNLHTRLASLITLMLRWCGSDHDILVGVYKLTLKKIHENFKEMNPNLIVELCRLANCEANCIVYDVGAQPVSIHLPLSRFLAGLHVQLHRYNLSFHSERLQLGIVSRPEWILEMVLRTQAMIAQVHIGLWRRNGYSILHQVFFYHNVKCRYEMLDQDIVLLQMGASLLDSNQFLIYLLHKFRLLNWPSMAFEETLSSARTEEDNIRYTILLSEEFLLLLIYIVCERYKVGVGCVSFDDCVKKEIVQQLCVKPLSHSELNRELPTDELIGQDNGLDRVINEVAIFKKPTAQVYGKGLYELKPEYYDDYNVFYYHYTKEELSKAEELQRMRRKQRGELECCPPPKLPKLTDSFKMVVNLLQCDVMLEIMDMVILRAVQNHPKTFSEVQLHRVLHLICCALQEEESGHYSEFFRFSERFEMLGLHKFLESLAGCTHIETHIDLIKWTLNKFRQIRRCHRTGDVDNAESDRKTGEEDDEAVNKRAASADEEKRRKAKLAAEKRARAMAEMCALQRSFIKYHKFYEYDESSLKPEQEAVAPTTTTEDFQEESKDRVVLGPNRCRRARLKEVSMCILCQEEEELKLDCDTAMVYGAYIQKSSVLCRTSAGGTSNNSSGGGGGTLKKKSSRTSPAEDDPNCLILPASLNSAPYVSSCGHIMHSSCWKKHFANVSSRESRRPYRARQPGSYDVDKKEFLCPLCETLCNAVMPVLPALENMGIYDVISGYNNIVQYEDWLKIQYGNVKYPKMMRLTGDSIKGTATSSWDHTTPVPDRWNLPENDCSLAALRSDLARSFSVQSTDGNEEEENFPPVRFVSAIRFSLEPQQQPDNDETAPNEAMDVVPSNDPSAENYEDVVMEHSTTTSSSSSSSSSREVTRPVRKWKLVSSSRRTVSNADAPPNNSKSHSEVNWLRISPSVLQMINKFGTALQNKYNPLSPLSNSSNSSTDSSSDNSENAVLNLWKCCAYNVHVLERQLRLDGMKSLLGDFTCRQQATLVALIRLSVMQIRLKGANYINYINRYLFSVLFGEMLSEFSVRDWDPLYMLISFTMLRPNAYADSPVVVPSANIIDVFTLNLILTTCVAQIFADYTINEHVFVLPESQGQQPPANADEESSTIRAEKADTQCLQSMWNALFNDDTCIDTVTLWRDLKQMLKPFLRAAAIFYHFLTQIEPPESLTVPGADTFENLCCYLGLSTSCNDIFNYPFILDLFSIWGRQELFTATKGNYVAKLPVYMPTKELISLPDDFSELINCVTTFSCPKSDHEDSRNPTLCLICGAMLCSQSYCCQINNNGNSTGACAYHALICGNGAGIFLRIRECEILLISHPNRGCFMPSPYVDEYGETDQGLRRGNPLKLCKDRYQRYTQMWLSHAIHEEVSRVLETANSVPITQWHHL